MLARIQECILYRGFSNGEILDDMTELINLYEADEEALKAREDQFFKSVNGLVELAGMYGFSGNIWLHRHHLRDSQHYRSNSSSDPKYSMNMRR